MRLRRRDGSYRAVRVEAQRWELRVDGVDRSSHQGFRAAELAAASIDRRSRTRSSLLRHTLILAAAFLLLAPVLIFREVTNPDYGPARDFADQIERAYGALNAGEAAITDFSLEADGFEGGVFEIDRGGVVADYLVLTGEHEGDCYLVRWRQNNVPFVARLLPRYPCIPGDQTLSFNPAEFEALGSNTSADGPLGWARVLPPETQIATWVLPAVIVLIYIMLQQLVSLSLVLIRGIPPRRVNVEQINETGDGPTSPST